MIPIIGIGIFVQIGGVGAGGGGKGLLQLVSAVFGVIFISIGVYATRKGWKIRQRVKEQFDEISDDVTAIADLVPGEAVVSGTARPINEISVEAPFTGKAVLAASAEIRIHYPQIVYQRFFGKERSRTLAQTQTATPFVVDDGTGTIRVEPTASPRTDFTLEPIASGYHFINLGDWSIAVFWTPTGMPNADRLIAFHQQTQELYDDPWREVGPITIGRFPLYRTGTIEPGKSEMDDIFMPRTTYEEGSIEPGEEVYVQGEVVEATTEGDEGTFVITGESDDGFRLSDRSPAEQGADILEYGRATGRVRSWYWTGIGNILIGGVILILAVVLL